MPQIPGFGNLAVQNPTTHILDVVHFPMVGMWAPQNPRAIRTWRSLSCHLYCRSTSLWTPNHHLLEADPQTVLQGHCDCKPITVRTAADEQTRKRCGKIIVGQFGPGGPSPAIRIAT